MNDRFLGLLDYQARQLTEVVPATDGRAALLATCEALARLAPEGEGWQQGHAVRAAPLAAICRRRRAEES